MTAKTSIRSHIRELEKGQLLSRLVVLAIVIALFLTAGIFCLRTISTGWKLFCISDDITYITEISNTSPNGWTDELLTDYNEEIEKRNNLINSENAFVAFIAGSNNFVRFITFIILATLVSSFGYISFKLSFVEVLVFNKYLKYKKRQKANRS